MQTFPPTIIGNHVTVRLLHPSFFTAYHAMFSSTVRAALHLPLEASCQATQEFLQAQINSLTTMDLFYCIFNNADNKLIGAIKIRDPQSQEALQNGQIGAWVNESYWGQDRYQEALTLATQAYFAHTNAESIGAFIDATNIRSLRAHTKFGFVVTGSSVGCCNAADGVTRIILKLLKQ